MKKLFLLAVLALAVYLWFKFDRTYQIDIPPVIAETPTTDDNEPQSLQDTLMELPAIGESDVILRYTAMTVRYDTDHLIPKWVAYELTDSETDGDVSRASGFSMDLNYHGRQAMREDYSNSGWDKGHMAPAADMKWSNKAMYESFYLVNVCPQNHTMNAGPWLRLEKWCRDKALKYGNLYIVSGPIIGSCKYGTIGAQKVAVPDKFFKALLAKDADGYCAIAFVMVNDTTKQSIPRSSISVDSLESLTGIDFFCNLPDSIENLIESKLDYKSWASTGK